MDKNKTIKNNRNALTRRAIALGTTGVILALLVAGTDDARDAATPEQQENIATPKTTMIMGGVGILSLLGSALLIRKRDSEYPQR